MKPFINSVCQEQSPRQPHRRSRPRELPENFSTYAAAAVARTGDLGAAGGPLKKVVTIHAAKNADINKVSIK